ncbi:MAG: acyl-[acyl-carrier-protein]--UDP-N-acetylglucosamine O-acyltransferase [Candidatus Marinimicrobia bacterium]|nr:acyl-[acyl-carrier-protein]--UDP-N-acetylglucosamine O-acyltransferase [Candidatus Neomarinimicrobiota bacterium]
MHPTAIIDSNSSIGKNVSIGAFSIIEPNVEIQDNTQIGNNVVICSGTQIGKNCKIYHSSVIGEKPQDLKFNGEKTLTIIGDEVLIREFVTINRGTIESGKTVIGNKSYLMASTHVAHDCIIGESVIMSNLATLGGHVEVDDKVIISGGVLVHQFCKIGSFSFIGGGYRVVQDVPPFIMAAGEPLKYSGINSIGLRRNGFSINTRKVIKEAYRLLFREKLSREKALVEIKNTLPINTEIKKIISFIENSNRGLI